MDPLFKEKAYTCCSEVIQSKVELLMTQMEEFQSATHEETKSSAGDKYETGRAMLHLEKEKVSTQLNQLALMKKTLDQLKNDRPGKTVGLGSVVKTNNGTFYLSVGLGPLEVENTKFFALSVVSPIGKLLYGKEKGESFTFNNTQYILEEVI